MATRHYVRTTHGIKLSVSFNLPSLVMNRLLSRDATAKIKQLLQTSKTTEPAGTVLSTVSLISATALTCRSQLTTVLLDPSLGEVLRFFLQNKGIQPR